ncbi:hypothetical protein M0R72_10125 [Candidatus Pacearchaeota archaeon]|nr:hypothetical protein [Candidatus Pacearchaeota archaeon]
MAELTRLAGSSVNLQEARPKKVKSTAEPPEALRPPQSICYVSGAHGSCGVGLLRAGLAIDESGLGDWVTAQNKAKKEKLGIWSKDKVR